MTFSVGALSNQHLFRCANWPGRCFDDGSVGSPSCLVDSDCDWLCTGAGAPDACCAGAGIAGLGCCVGQLGTGG